MRYTLPLSLSDPMSLLHTMPLELVAFLCPKHCTQASSRRSGLPKAPFNMSSDGRACCKDADKSLYSPNLNTLPRGIQHDHIDVYHRYISLLYLLFCERLDTEF